MIQVQNKIKEISEVINDKNGVINMAWLQNNINELEVLIKEACKSDRDLLIAFSKRIDEVSDRNFMSPIETVVDDFINNYIVTLI